MEESIPQETLSLVNDAKKLHSHFGPFLAYGLRVGFIGLRETKKKKGDPDLSVNVSLPYKTPISCILDGIQVATSCTLGNKRLKVRNSNQITFNFKVKNGGTLMVTIKPVNFKKFKDEFMVKTSTDEEMEKLAYKVLVKPENELFRVRIRRLK